MAPWVYDPHSGGVKISVRLQAELLSTVKEYAHDKSWYPAHQLTLRFKSQFCYVDTVESGDTRQLPLCRLRHFSHTHLQQLPYGSSFPEILLTNHLIFFDVFDSYFAKIW